MCGHYVCKLCVTYSMPINVIQHFFTKSELQKNVVCHPAHTIIIEHVRVEIDNKYSKCMVSLFKELGEQTEIQ